jgi:diguanylate cyclase (GGDEF)-like protein/PAS domain S-box-containing protein
MRLPIRLRRGTLRPFAAGGRRTIIAIFAIYAAIALVTSGLSLWATKRSQNRATIVQVASRQRTLAERYVTEILLMRAGQQADPATIGTVLQESAHALLDGGTAPAVNGDDDEQQLAAASGAALRAQFVQQGRLIDDLIATGEAVLGKRPATTLPVTGGEHLETLAPVQRLRVLAALTSNVSLDAARTIASKADANISSLITMQIALGAGGLVLSLLLAAALMATTRRQTAHFRSLAQSSQDLVAVLGDGGCRYVSPSVATMVGRPERELFGDGLLDCVHADDRELLARVATTGEPADTSFRVRNASGEWRHLEARATDLRGDRHLRGVVVNARDATERVRLEQELTTQSRRDSFASKLGEALEMADEEEAVFDVVERAMTETSAPTPMELLLSDSSRANLNRVAVSPEAPAPGCPVKSPFSCVAVRRGSAVVFESSDELNSCPKLRDRPGGACSAVCVPVSFMGRSLGVLHSTGPEHAPLAKEKIAQLATLAGQAGARIGTVRAFEKTQLQASTDGLTGLVNRRTLEKELRGLFKGDAPFALAIADLDNFKQLNDMHGHETGDRALRLFAQVAQDTLRDQDVIARWGGEEFVIALEGLDRFAAIAILDRLRERLGQAHPGETPRFTVSFGVADSAQADTLEGLLAIADAGLYAAKHGGRDRAHIGDPADVPKIPPRAAEAAPAPAVRRGTRPSLHEATDEEEPHPNGVEIR